MIKITIVSIKVDSSFAEEVPIFKVGDIAYYVIRDSGARLSDYFRDEACTTRYAWELVKKYGLTLVEPW